MLTLNYWNCQDPPLPLPHSQAGVYSYSDFSYCHSGRSETEIRNLATSDCSEIPDLHFVTSGMTIRKSISTEPSPGYEAGEGIGVFYPFLPLSLLFYFIL